MRENKQVKSCPRYKGEHWHLIASDNVYCHAVGQWLKEPSSITYKELKKKWSEEKK